MSNKEFISKIYLELSKINSKKQNYLFNKQIIHFTKKNMKKANRHRPKKKSKILHYSALEKFKLKSQKATMIYLLE